MPTLAISERTYEYDMMNQALSRTIGPVTLVAARKTWKELSKSVGASWVPSAA